MKKHVNNRIPESLRWFEVLATKNEPAFDDLLRRVLMPKIEFFALTYSKGVEPAQQEAIDKAVEKVHDVFIRVTNEELQPTTNPVKYLLSTAQNAINDYFEASKEESASTDIAALRWIDEKIPTGQDKESPIDEAEEESFGWRTFKLKEKPRRKSTDVFHPQHPLLRTLMRYFYNPPANPKRRAQWEKALVQLKLAGKRAKLLIDTMSGEVDKLVIKEYLLGRKQVDIARQWDKQKSNISRTLKTWFGKWHWDDDYVKTVRMSLLLHNLVEISHEVEKRVLKKYPELRPYGNRWRWDGCFYPQRINYMVLEAERGYWKLLHEKVTTDHRAVACFGNLPEDDVPMLDRFIQYGLGHWWEKILGGCGDWKYWDEDWEYWEDEEWPPGA